LGDVTPNQVFKNQDNYNTVQRINLAKMKYNKQLGEKSKNKIKVGDKVRIQVKKDLFKKGYEITYSKKVYLVESRDDNVATLDDDSKHKLKYLSVVNQNSQDITTTRKDDAEKRIKTRQRLQREGLSTLDESVI
jgi:hypothetical protein